MKKIQVCILLIWILLLSSCMGIIQIGSSNSAKISVNFRRGYMGSYSSLYQGQVLPKRVMIYVDKLKSNYEIESNFSSNIFERTNSLNGMNNFVFPNIEVPESGSYSVTAVTLGTSCYVSCSGSNMCSDYNKGRPRFRKVTIIVNAEDAPDVIYMEPMGFTGCL